METPEWLTRELVQKFLGDNEELDTFSVESATKPGDNFLSIIYCVKVTPKGGEPRSMILKSAIPMDELEPFKCFPKETQMYQEYIPQFEKIWFDKTGEVISFGPQCHFATEQPLGIIVMDDLRALGYSMRDRKVGLCGREMRMVLEKIAKFHACSVKFNEEVKLVVVFLVKH